MIGPRYNMTCDMRYCHDSMSWFNVHGIQWGTCPWFFVYDSHCGTLPMILCILWDLAHDSLFIAGLCPWFFVYCGTLPMILSLLRDFAHDSFFIAGLCPWFFLELQDSTIIYLMYSTSYVAKSAILQCVIQITCGSGI